MRRLAVLGGMLCFVADGVYSRELAQQPAPPNPSRTVFVFMFIAVCGVSAIVSALLPLKSARLVLLSFSTVGLLVLGFLAIFSIGLLLWLAVIPMAVASLRLLISPLPRVFALLSGGSIAALVLAIGLATTQ